MRTTSYISAAALAAALLSVPQLAHAQGLGISLGLGGDSGIGVDVNVGGSEGLVDADVNVGGENGLDVGAGVGSSDGSLVDVNVNAGDSDSGSGSNLVDVDIGGDADPATDRSLVDLDVGTRTGPNGGDLIDLNVGNSQSGGQPPAAVGSGSGSGGSGLLNGGVRIAALDEAVRADALIALVDSPNLADIDLDAAIDDRRVSIVAAADLLGARALADIEAAVELGGPGREGLLEALADSAVLGAILGNEGIDLSDVLAVQIAENGATQVIVLDGVVDVALLGDDADLADVGVADLADLDIDLLTDDQLAEIDLDLLPEAVRTEVELRLGGNNGDLADLTVGELADLNLDLLSDEELAQINLDLLPEELRTAIAVRLLGDNGNLADISIGDLAAISVDLPGGGDDGSGGGDDGSGGGDDGSGGGDDGSGGGDGGAGGGDDGSGGGDDGAGGGDDGSGGGDDGTGGGNDGSSGGTPGSGSGTDGNGAVATRPPGQADTGLRIAALDCGIGVLALAQGRVATPATIASAQSLELVRIEGCARSLMDPGVDAIRAALDNNTAISDVLEGAQIPLDQVIGATIQGGTLTVFVDPIDA